MEVDCEEKINLIQMNGAAYVWSSRDWKILRGLRVVGCFVGNLATPTKQDRIAALPLALLEEETTLLLEKGFAKLVNPSKLSDPPNEELRLKSKTLRETLLADQAEIMKNQRMQEISSKIDVIMKGKKTKKCDEGTSGELTKEDIIQQECNKIQISKSNLSIQICTRDPWIEDDCGENCIWDYPKGKSLRKYLVFKDLWERGYYITLGGKFGGDYLVYPQDPIKFHAFFIVICLEKNEKLQMQDIITYGRLGNSVKKTVVLAYLDDASQISYQSIQWAGF